MALIKVPTALDILATTVVCDTGVPLLSWIRYVIPHELVLLISNKILPETFFLKINVPLVSKVI